MHAPKRPFSLRPLCRVLACALVPAPALALDAGALPQGGNIVAGSGDIRTGGRSMVIDQHSHRLITNWRSFDIGSKAKVHFNQPSSSAVALNRVTGGSASQVFGSLTSNGQVFLVNPNGVYFAPGASVDVGGLVASTLDLSDQRFLAGDYVFDGSGGGEVVNAGSIRAQGGVALVGARVRNVGEIRTPGGVTALAAGDKVRLDFDGDGLISVEVDRAALQAQAVNAGLIQADGGVVLMQAKSRDALQATVVENTGVIRARSIGQRQGRIVLDGGDGGVTVNHGLLDASGQGGGDRGGQVQVLGEKVAVTGTIDASGAAGGGVILVGGGFQGNGTVRNAQAAFIDAGAVLNADATASGDGGTVVVWSDDTTRFYGRISARGGAQGGNGGLVETSGKNWLDASGRVDASAAHGKAGTWLMDPRNVTISSGPGSGGSFEDGNVFVPIDDNATVAASSINDSLNNGTSVTITTGTSGTQAGDITVDSGAVIDKTAGGEATLTLQAARHITVNGTIQSSSDKLNIVLNSRAQDGAIGHVNVDGASIATNGGSLVIGGGSDPTTGYAIGASSGVTNGVRIANSTIDTGAGDITINGQAGTSTAAGVSLPDSASSTITTTSGDITIRGRATGGNAVLIQGTQTVQTDSGSISLSGEADSGRGFRLGSSSSGTVLVKTNSGSIHLSAKSQTGDGISFLNGFTMQTTSGDIALDSDAVIEFKGGKVHSTDGGNVTVAGDADITMERADIRTGGGVLDVRAGTNIEVTEDTVLETDGGRMTLNSRAQGGTTGYVNLDKSSVDTGGGDLVIGGGVDPTTGYAIGASSGITNGVRIAGSTIDTGAGDITINGQAGTTGAAGVSLPSTAGSTITTTSGNIVVRGRAVGGNAVLIQGAQTIKTDSGSISLTGVSDSGNGLRLGSNVSNVLLQTGTGSIHLSGSTQTGLGISVVAGFTLKTAGGDVALDSLGDLEIANASVATAGGDVTIRATRHIAFKGSAPSEITSAGGSIVLNARSSGAAQGYVDLRGATLLSSGGDIVIGGGTDPTSGYAIGADTTSGGQITNGVRFGETVLDAGAGDIVVNGQGGTEAATGVSLANSSTNVIRTTTGNIAINGASHASASSSGSGVIVQTGNHTISSDSGRIAINGHSHGSGDGVRVGTTGVSTIRVSTGGDIVIAGTSAGAGDGANVGGGDLVIEAQGGGTLTVRGRSADGNGVTVGPVGSTSKTTLRTARGGIVIDGESVNGYGVNLYASATSGDTAGRGVAIVESTAGGDIRMRGASIASVGLRNSPISTGDTRVTAVGGNIVLEGHSQQDDAVQISPSLKTTTGNAASSAYQALNGGNLTVLGDRISVAGNRTAFQGSGGRLTIAPTTPGVTVGFGSGTEGELYLSNTALRSIEGVWSEIVVGSPTAGRVEIGATLPENIRVQPRAVDRYNTPKPGDPYGADARLAVAQAQMEAGAPLRLAALDAPLRMDRDAAVLPGTAGQQAGTAPSVDVDCVEDCDDEEDDIPAEDE